MVSPAVPASPRRRPGLWARLECPTASCAVCRPLRVRLARTIRGGPLRSLSVTAPIGWPLCMPGAGGQAQMRKHGWVWHGAWHGWHGCGPHRGVIVAHDWSPGPHASAKERAQGRGIDRSMANCGRNSRATLREGEEHGHASAMSIAEGCNRRGI